MAEPQLITLNIGGKHFTTSRDTLTKYPETLLGRMFADDQKVGHQKIPFFDRSDILFDAILGFYRTGLLIKPENIPIQIWQAELGFWGLPEEESLPDLKDEIATIKGDLKKITTSIDAINTRSTDLTYMMNDLLNLFCKVFKIDPSDDDFNRPY